MKENEKSFSPIDVNGRTHVLVRVKNRTPLYPMPNYRNTGMALHAILPKGMSFKKWIENQKV